MFEHASEFKKGENSSRFLVRDYSLSHVHAVIENDDMSNGDDRISITTINYASKQTMLVVLSLHEENRMREFLNRREQVREARRMNIVSECWDEAHQMNSAFDAIKRLMNETTRQISTSKSYIASKERELRDLRIQWQHCARDMQRFGSEYVLLED